MKKQMIQLLVVLVLLVGAVAAFLLLRDTGEPVVEETVDDTVYVLGGVPQPFVKSVEMRAAGGESFTITNGFENAIQEGNASDDRYSIDGLDESTLNKTLLKSVLTTAGNLPAKKILAENADTATLTTYGLANPAHTLVVHYEDSTVEMGIGDNAPGSEGVYVSAGGNVYLVELSRMTNLRKGRLDFVSTAITPGNSQTSQFEQVILAGTAYPEPIVMEKLTDTELNSMTGMSSYRITSPERLEVDSQNGIVPLQSVFGLTASYVVDVAKYRDEAAAPYGLVEPSIEIVVTPLNTDPENSIAPFTLALSETNAEGYVYAQVSGGDYVYQVPTTSLPFLGLGIFDLMQKMVILPHIDTVSQVEVLTAAGTHVFALTGEGDEMTVIGDGVELDAKNFRQFYQTLIAASYDSEIGDEAEAVDTETEAESETETSATENTDAAEATETASAADYDDVLLRITYRYRDGNPADAVTFRPGPARRARIALNDGREFYALSTYVDRVLEDLPKVLAGEEVKSYF